MFALDKSTNVSIKCFSVRARAHTHTSAGKVNNGFLVNLQPEAYGEALSVCLSESVGLKSFLGFLLPKSYVQSSVHDHD